MASSEPVEHTDVRCPPLRSEDHSEETGDSSSLLSTWRSITTDTFFLKTGYENNIELFTVLIYLFIFEQ